MITLNAKTLTVYRTHLPAGLHQKLINLSNLRLFINALKEQIFHQYFEPITYQDLLIQAELADYGADNDGGRRLKRMIDIGFEKEEHFINEYPQVNESISEEEFKAVVIKISVKFPINVIKRQTFYFITTSGSTKLNQDITKFETLLLTPYISTHSSRFFKILLDIFRKSHSMVVSPLYLSTEKMLLILDYLLNKGLNIENLKKRESLLREEILSYIGLTLDTKEVLKKEEGNVNSRSLENIEISLLLQDLMNIVEQEQENIQSQPQNIDNSRFMDTEDSNDQTPHDTQETMTPFSQQSIFTQQVSLSGSSQLTQYTQNTITPSNSAVVEANIEIVTPTNNSQFSTTLQSLLSEINQITTLTVGNLPVSKVQVCDWIHFNCGSSGNTSKIISSGQRFGSGAKFLLRKGAFLDDDEFKRMKKIQELKRKRIREENSDSELRSNQGKRKRQGIDPQTNEHELSSDKEVTDNITERDSNDVCSNENGVESSDEHEQQEPNDQNDSFTTPFNVTGLQLMLYIWSLVL